MKGEGRDASAHIAIGHVVYGEVVDVDSVLLRGGGPAEDPHGPQNVPDEKLLRRKIGYSSCRFVLGLSQVLAQGALFEVKLRQAPVRMMSDENTWQNCEEFSSAAAIDHGRGR
jgi:hypothetical protein